MSQSGDDIAIVGMACICPGAPDVGKFWQNIVSKVDAISDPPRSWGAESGSLTESIYCTRGGYLGDAVIQSLEKDGKSGPFDGGDPEGFLVARAARDAMIDAGYVERPVERAGASVILGRSSYLNRNLTAVVQHGLVVDQTVEITRQLHPELTEEELREIKARLEASLPAPDADQALDAISNTVAIRILNDLNLTGSGYVVDAGSASSLIAVKLGMQDLLSGKSDLAIVGGMHVPISPPTLLAFCNLRALSATARIRPFDKDADGMLLGEGVGTIVLKRRGDAERDGDRVYALIKGIGTASDSRTAGLTTPGVADSEAALRLAYETSGVSPRTVELIETNGTGTPCEDVAEIEALGRVFGSRVGQQPWCAVGSVKSMIGNLMPSAGIVGIIKTALALYHKVLPPTLNCSEPNPELEIEKTPFYINAEPRPWFHGKPDPRRAGVNTLAFGGVDTHAVLEEQEGAEGPGDNSYLHTWDSEIFIIEGESRSDLILAGERLQGFLSSGPEVELKDLAYTLNCPLRESTGCRLSIVATSLDELSKKLAFALQRLSDPECAKVQDRSGIFFFEETLYQEGSLAFLFPGEGSQYLNMLGDLCINFPEMRAIFDRIDQVFIEDNRESVLTEMLFPAGSNPGAADPQSEEDIFQMHFAVAAVLAADFALYTLLDRLEIRADAMTGHSSGELTALLASGAMPIEEKDDLVALGHDLIAIYGSMEENVPEAKLLTVGATDPAVVASILAQKNGEYYLAMDNCPHQVILCGIDEKISHIMKSLQGKGAICSLLQFSRPYHTPLFRAAREKFARFYSKRKVAAPHTTLYSCATAEPFPRDPDGIRDTATDQWARAVRFRETVEAMHDSGVRLFVEVGPRGNLTSFVSDILKDRQHLAVPSNLPRSTGILQLHHLIGLLAAHGVPMRLDYLYRHRAPRKVSLDGVKDQSVTAAEERDRVELSMELPRLRVAEQGRARPAAPGPCASPSICESRPVKQDPVAREASRDGKAPASQPASSDSGATEEVDADRRTRLMKRYFQTMEQFIDIQKEVLDAYRSEKRQ